MKVDMVMPQMGESIAEGTILRWLKKEGDLVAKDENILEISTDKVDSEIPAPAAGKLVALLAAEGETVPVGKVIAHIETDANAAVETPKQKAPAEEQKAPADPEAAQRQNAAPAGRLVQEPGTAEAAKPPKQDSKSQPPAPRTPPQPERKTEGQPQPVAAAPRGSQPEAESPEGNGGGGRFYSPLVRSIARSEGISHEELAQIEGSGRGGRVTKEDLLAYVERRGGSKTAAPAGPKPPAQAPAQPATPAAPAPVSPAERPSEPSEPREPRTAPAPTGRGTTVPSIGQPTESRESPDGRIDVVPMDHVRQRIAEHMVRSKATSPHVASVTEVDMTRIVRYREAEKEAFEQREGIKLTYTPFFVQAVVRALKDFPVVNASVEGTNVLLKRFVHIGIAVSVDYGLIVPVIKHADTLSFLGIARAVNDLATRARTKALKPDEVSGGTFSITNMGTVGTLFGVPIIAQPQVGIIGIGSIQKRPVVREDAIAIRSMMYMCLSYDHRIIDGATGGSFVERVRHYLETMELA